VRLAVAKPKRPLPLKSATVMECGPLPTATGDPAGCENVPSPLPTRMVTVLSVKLATARPSLPLPRKSPTARASGVFPTGMGEPVAGVNVPSPLPNKMMTEPLLATFKSSVAIARSSLPSPLKSPTTIEFTDLETPNGDPETVLNAPSPYPNETTSSVPLTSFPAARSRFPSPLKSAATRDVEDAPGIARYVEGVVNEPFPLPRKAMARLLSNSVTAKPRFPLLLKSPTVRAPG